MASNLSNYGQISGGTTGEFKLPWTILLSISTGWNLAHLTDSRSGLRQDKFNGSTTVEKRKKERDEEDQLCSRSQWVTDPLHGPLSPTPCSLSPWPSPLSSVLYILRCLSLSSSGSLSLVSCSPASVRGNVSRASSSARPRKPCAFLT